MSYYEIIKEFQRVLKGYAENIFRTYGRELVLRLEEYNLLQHKANTIESSTALGFILEEFLVAKLDMYTHSGSSEVIVDRLINAKSKLSYDCFSNYNGIRFLVNIKTEKEGSNNDAIAAINQLYGNYCATDPNQEKAFVVLKVKYRIRESDEGEILRKGKPRHIYIDGVEVFNLEEIDFSNGHHQDGRRWSDKSTGNNGRLVVSQAFRRTHTLEADKVSYKNTCKMIDEMQNPQG